jgi:hypothetical protein
MTVLAKANSELLFWPKYRKRNDRQHKHTTGKYSFLPLVDRHFESKMFGFPAN